MSSDALILQALRDKQKYRTLISSVPMGMLGPEAQAVLGWYPIYYQAYPEHERVDVEALDALIRLRSGYTREQFAIMQHSLQLLRMVPDETAIKGVVNQLYERDFSGRMGSILARYNNGEEIDLVYESSRLSQEVQRTIAQGTSTEWINDTIESILAQEENDYGLKFPLGLLQGAIKGLLGGASVAIAGRPDKGKTSLIAFILAEFAKQLDKYFSPDRPILWLNNEGKGQRIVPRIYQAALGVDMDELVAMSNAGTLRQSYEAVVGRVDRIRVKDMHGSSFAQIEQVIEAMKPSVVVWDMMANFRLGSANAGGNKADEIEEKWQVAREMAVRHDFVSLGTVQISNEGGNMLYPPYSAMKDSKTGIQGATDIILMMGALDTPDMASLRGLATPKNKFQMPGRPSHVQGEVFFDASRCRFEEGTAPKTPSSPNA
jgi:hypothetical protein